MQQECTPVIETTRLVLRKVCIEDAVDIHAYVQNPNVLRYTTGTPPLEFTETESFVQGLANKSSGDFSWAIRQKSALAVIGVIELSLDENLSGFVDYAIAEEYWNQGIMTEAVRAVLNWAFRTYTTLESVSSSAMTANPSSTRVQQKCGMKLLRTEYHTWSKFDEPVELAICSISRDAWVAGNHS